MKTADTFSLTHERVDDIPLLLGFMQQLPGAVLGYLLERNSHCYVAWHVSVGDDGSAVFGVNYRALTPGLNPGVFRMLCQMLLQEASEFDDRMRKAGVLR